MELNILLTNYLPAFRLSRYLRTTRAPGTARRVIRVLRKWTRLMAIHACPRRYLI